MLLLIVVAVGGVLFGLAWWSSGRKKSAATQVGMSETEKDYLSRGTWRSGQL
jgi:hypothetical protein